MGRGRVGSGEGRGVWVSFWLEGFMCRRGGRYEGTQSLSGFRSMRYPGMLIGDSGWRH